MAVSPGVDHLELCDLLAVEVDRFATLIDGVPLDIAVPSCPGWSLRDLTAHLGTVHRWAEHLVRARAQERIPSSSMGLGEPSPSPAWLREGGQVLVATLRSADPEEPMWAWGADKHVRFWSRRQLHETLVHTMDAELALGKAPAAAASLAADAVDEFLANLPRAVYFSPKVANLRGDGAQLEFRATDEDRAWWVTLGAEGFEVAPGTRSAPAAPAGATLKGPADVLLLVLYRRLPVGTAGMTVSGDASLVDFWLANSALE
jgi:uncharacterized protein (TIGR03083 family)